MLAIKKLNNNAVLCRDGQGRDVIAMGRGVGFGGEFPRELPLSKIEHTFYDIDPKAVSYTHLTLPTILRV